MVFKVPIFVGLVTNEESEVWKFFFSKHLESLELRNRFQKCFIVLHIFLDSSRWLVLTCFDKLYRRHGHKNVQEPPDTNGFFFHLILRIIHKYMTMTTQFLVLVAPHIQSNYFVACFYTLIILLCLMVWYGMVRYGMVWYRMV